MFPNNSLVGEIQWRQPSDFGANYTVLSPVSVIPDVDSDGVQDLIIFIATEDKVCHSGAVINAVARPQGIAGMLFISILSFKRKCPEASGTCGFGAGSFPRCRDVLPYQCKCFMVKKKRRKELARNPSPFSVCAPRCVWGEPGQDELAVFWDAAQRSGSEQTLTGLALR